MIRRKKINFQEYIFSLLESKDEITINDIAKAALVSPADSSVRRAIQRSLKTLIENKKLQSFGNARARVYALRKSQDSSNLRSSVSKQKIIYYDQNFLRSYKPNQSFYLTQMQRQELLNVGKVENNEQLAGTYAKRILNRLLIDLSWNSSRLEGNTYSLIETQRLIELNESAEGKNAAEAQMILNHKNAIEFLLEIAMQEKVTYQDICNVHALLSDNLLGDPSASGRLRNIAVGITGSAYRPIDNPHILKEYFELFLDKFNAIEHPFEQSFFSLIHLSYLQPFEDVNKRTARLTSNIPLIKYNFRPLGFIDVDQKEYAQSLLQLYENKNIEFIRELYIQAYKRSSKHYSAVQQNMGEPNLLKLKYRNIIHGIVHDVVQQKVPGSQLPKVIQNLIETRTSSHLDRQELFKLIETEILSLHEGNIARFKISAKEYLDWKAAH